MIAIITGSGGLIGFESARFFLSKGFEIIGIDNDMRKYFFGSEASIVSNLNNLKDFENYTHYNIDIRSYQEIEKIFLKYNQDIKLIVHTAAQPSHDWAAREPFTDFSVNANGTLNLLESTRQFCPKASFIFTSTNKVYGDAPNFLPLIEKEKRWSVDKNHPFSTYGIDENMSIDQTKHSLFGASKVSADILVQEYGRYFGMNTVSFRGGCLTGPAHKGAELHGFLSYLVKCAIEKKKYTIFGYKGKQVRDNIHSFDLVNAFWHYYQKPKIAEVYNIGGGIHSNISILECIDMVEEICGIKLNYIVSNEARIGDHIWYISDIRKFQRDYPFWSYKFDIKKILQEIVSTV